MVVGPAIPTIRDLVARHGHAYTIERLPPGRWSSEPQARYANALQAAMARQRVYVEGFAIPRRSGLAVLHAWVTDPRSPAVAHDPTWGTGREYFGIPFKFNYVLRVGEKAGHPVEAAPGSGVRTSKGLPKEASAHVQECRERLVRSNMYA